MIHGRHSRQMETNFALWIMKIVTPFEIGSLLSLSVTSAWIWKEESVGKYPTLYTYYKLLLTCMLKLAISRWNLELTTGWWIDGKLLADSFAFRAVRQVWHLSWNAQKMIAPWLSFLRYENRNCQIWLASFFWFAPDLSRSIDMRELPYPCPRFVHLGISAQSPMDLTSHSHILRLRRRLNFSGDMNKKKKPSEHPQPYSL
jgi:hypothetical protein